jgi:hypothetical protein
MTYQDKKMKPDGIHFAPGIIKGLDFPIFLDLTMPLIKNEIDRMIQKEIEEVLKIPKHKNKAEFPGRINYKIHNYCARCKIKYGKDVYRCKNCKSRVRTKAWASNYSRKKHNG